MSYSLYRLLSWVFWLLGPSLLKARVKRGKEDVSRVHERFARNLDARPDGRVIWLHGASVGETALLRGMVEAWDVSAFQPVTFLFTSQTVTSASLFAKTPNAQHIHQYAPLDTIGATRRFIAHWRPNLGIFAEGEIWPNLLDTADRNGVPLALINARMTEKSREGWRKRGAFGKAVFNKFAWISAANAPTADALSEIIGHDVPNLGNIKLALHPPKPDTALVGRLKSDFVGARKCVVAASTHETEEAFFLDALENCQVGDSLCAIIAPRHPERGEEIRHLIQQRGFSLAQRSAGELPNRDTQIYLADSLGEMANWYALADRVFLGGGTKAGIGGHNPVEILHFEKPIASGRYVHNFTDVFEALASLQCSTPVDTPADLASWISGSPPIDWQDVERWLNHHNTALPATLEALTRLLDMTEKNT